MAAAANISKSTIGNILEGLKKAGYMVQINKNTRKITNKKELLDKWVLFYHEKLKPSLARGTFRFMPHTQNQWATFSLDKASFWGGEPAANLLTSYLSPEIWTLYSKEGKSDLLKKIKLVPDPKKGNVLLYAPFWNIEHPMFQINYNSIVHPLLVYADLLATTDSRNIETATKIYEKFVSTYIAE